MGTLTDRIKARKPQPEPQPIVEKMSPFLRRLRERRLDPKVLYNGAWQSHDDGGAA